MTVTLARLVGAITVNPVLSLSQVYAYKIFAPVPLSDIHIYIYIYTGVNARYTVGINRRGLATKSLEPKTVCRRSRSSQEHRDAL